MVWASGAAVVAGAASVVAGAAVVASAVVAGAAVVVAAVVAGAASVVAAPPVSAVLSASSSSSPQLAATSARAMIDATKRLRVRVTVPSPVRWFPERRVYSSDQAGKVTQASAGILAGDEGVVAVELLVDVLLGQVVERGVEVGAATRPERAVTGRRLRHRGGETEAVAVGGGDRDLDAVRGVLGGVARQYLRLERHHVLVRTADVVELDHGFADD